MDSAEIVQDTEDEGDITSDCQDKKVHTDSGSQDKAEETEKGTKRMIPHSRRNNPKSLLFFKKKDHIDC